MLQLQWTAPLNLPVMINKFFANPEHITQLKNAKEY